MSDQRHAPAKTDVELEQELYKKRENIYVREVHGKWAFLRNLAGAILLGIYYGLPWLSWNGQPLVLFDLPARKFYLFGITLWPQDFFYLALLLIISALALFFFTALAGRLWCGYACPQTVWTDVFLWMERKIEGNRQARIKLDKAGMSRDKFLRKFTKHLAWGLFSLWTGITFVGYFTPMQTLWQEALTNSLGPWETFWILFYGFATYGNAGWLREQVCIYMCPYSRFQSAMFDRDTLLIAYDERRGEPRGGRKIGRDPSELGLGSCIDCKICVQVCPTGIDIRNGLQYQCIGCAACIDACDGVMDKMGYPRGLVKYTTENAMEGQQTHIVRPRMFVYGALLILITTALFYSLFTRIPLEVDIIRDRNALYVQSDEGLIENVYTLKIVNMKESEETYHLSIEGLEGAELINSAGDFSVPAGQVLEVPVRVKIDPVDLKSTSSNINFRLKSLTSDNLEVVEHGRFLGPRG
ncbi:MAG: cytochrome c oxidase accessory protein CcoG [Gammaproteobacteria bacterium]|nr:cytochrome c oxidase accessory protein CcoG [Gammaproteobacteria bacterium]MBU1655653.1 cytochrome c oxidase accessory protein CcoG [Gammaproteobacteria bacterium]MBU1960306.1 cytochrome c oxidase accessory protein CcoG [Gammaproteobacteria bacterium]